MKAEKKAMEVIRRLQEVYGEDFETALDWDEPWQLLFSVLLSAQTTDENVNKVTKELFKQLPSVQAIATAPRDEVEKLIYSTGYYKSKARNLQNCAEKLLEEFDGMVPNHISQLTSLPGVGRKTANVVIHVLDHEPAGIVMDTHIQRVTQRLGFIKKKSAVEGENTMTQVLPRGEWKIWGDLLIQHGREICDARKPLCHSCTLADICPSAGEFQ